MRRELPAPFLGPCRPSRLPPVNVPLTGWLSLSQTGSGVLWQKEGPSKASGTYICLSP